MTKNIKRPLSILLAVLMIAGVFAALPLTAYASDDPYAELLNTTTAVNFDGKEWYLIENNSTAVDAGTVTLLSKECVAASQYNSSGSYVEYASSTVKTAVDNWYNNNITSNAKTAVFDNKMFLLTKDQANAMTTDTRKCSQASEANYNYWWLCSPGSFGNFASCVYGGNGNVLAYGYSVVYALGVRPALKLNLSSVIFSSESKTFTVGSAANDIIINSAEHGSVTANPASAAAGTTVTLTAQPDEGCKLKNISAYKGIVSDSFSSQYNVYDYSGTHFNLKVDETSAYGWTIGYGKDDPVVKVTSKSDTSIDRVVLEADAKIGIRGTIKANVGTVTRNGNTITVSGINNKTVTIYSEDYAYSSIESAEVYGKTADYGELTLTGTDDPNVFTFTMPDSAVSVSAEFEVSVDKTALNNAITAAETLYDSIKDDTNYSTIASTLKTAIDAAKEVADSETADQDAVDAAATTITTAKTTAETDKKDVDDTKAANAVIEKINNLPSTDTITSANKDAIEDARKAYNDLTADQKDKVDADKLQKLTDAETALKDAVDTETAQATTDTINALPVAENVTTADKDAIEAARKAYNDLTDDQKKKVSDDTLKKLTDAEDALKAAGVSDTINALPAADEVTTANKEAIAAARKVYDDLTDDQKSYVAPETLKKLTDAESALAVAEVNAAIDALPAADEVTTANKDAIEAARKAYDELTDDEKAKIAPETLKKLNDAESALAVATANEAINVLPAADEVTTANKEAIEAARKAYDALTDDEKAKITPETLKKLTDAESALAVATAIEAINALPAADEVTTANKDAIEAARKAYNDLTDDQKAKVSEDTLKKLTDAESAFTVASVSEKINALPDADKVTTADKEAIEEARGFYDALTDAQKTKVSEDTLKKLTDAEAALKDAVDTAAANTASEAINDLPDADKVTTADKDAIEAARKAYDDLTDDQKAKVDAETLKKLTDAEAALKDAADTAAANTVSEAINALPDADKVTTADKDAIKAARKAYDDLTDDQKAKVDAETLKKLTDAETALAAAEKDAADTAAANTASETINALPDADKVTTADKDAIEAARKAYDDLTDDQKAKVSEDTLKKLTDAETALAKEKADTKAANDVTNTINALPDADKVTTADKEAIAAAGKAYDDLTDDQKAKVDAETLKKLTDAETALAKEEADTKAANDVTNTINALPDADKVTTANKDAIEAARKAYDDLTDDQKAKVDAETLKKLTDAEAALKDAVDTAAANTASEAINALPDADKVTTADKDAIEAARKAYDDLTDDQKAKVDAETLKKLTDAETALAAAEKQAADEEQAAKELAAAKTNAQKAMNNQVTVTQKGKKITVKWSKSTAADGYQVFAQYCGKKTTKPVKTIKKNTTTKVNITKINGKKINLKKQFKVFVKAYKVVNGKKVTLAKSIVGHVVGVKNAKYTNVKSIKVTKSKLTVKVGKTAKVKAKVTLVDKNKKHIPKSHAAKFRYRTSNKKIATVTKSGKIKGIKKGTCTIYVYAINGKMKKVKVTVK